MGAKAGGGDVVEEHLPLTHLWYHVLLVLWDQGLHGYGIIKEIERRTEGRLVPETGTLYTALRRMQDEGLLDGERERGGGRRGATYRLTARGRSVLKAETQRLHRLVDMARAMKILDPRLAGEVRR